MNLREKTNGPANQPIISRILHHPLLEERVRWCSTLLQTMCYTALDHPFYTCAVGSIAGALVNNEENGTQDEALLAAGYLAYLGLKIIRDYMVFPQHRERTTFSTLPSLEEKMAKAPLNHASLLALGGGIIAAMESLETLEFRVYLQQIMEGEQNKEAGFFIRDYVFQHLALHTALIDASLTATRYAVNLVHGRRAQEKPLSRLQHWWNFPFEHPVAAGLLAASYAIIDGRLPSNPTQTQELQHLVLLGGAGTATTLAAGSLLHTDSMKYLGNAVLSRWHSVRGRHQQAIERWKRAMRVSTAVVTKIEDGIRLADLYNRADQPEEALAAWRNILPLFEVVDEKIGPLDVLRSVFSGRSATRRFDPFNLGSQITTQPRNTISVYKNSRLARRRALAKTYNEEGAAERIFAITETARRVTARHVLKNPLVEIPVGVIDGNTLITLRSRHPDLSVDSKLSGSYRKELPKDFKRFAHYVASNLVWFQVEMSRRVITRKNEKGQLEHLLDCFGVTIPLEVLDYEQKIVGGAFLGRETDKCYRLKVPSSDETVRTLYQAIEGRILQHVRSLQQQNDCLIHGDLTKRNVLMDGMLIDLEKVCIGHPLVDLACLAVDLNSHQTENELLHRYSLEAPQEMHHKISHNAYEQARLYASLGLAGTTLAKGRNREARQFLRWAREALNALGDEETSRSLEKYLVATGRKSLV